jgi:hypothetical protein
LNLCEQAVEFLDFVIDQISRTALYEQLFDEIKSLRPYASVQTLIVVEEGKSCQKPSL